MPSPYSPPTLTCHGRVADLTSTLPSSNSVYDGGTFPAMYASGPA